MGTFLFQIPLHFFALFVHSQNHFQTRLLFSKGCRFRLFFLQKQRPALRSVLPSFFFTKKTTEQSFLCSGPLIQNEQVLLPVFLEIRHKPGSGKNIRSLHFRTAHITENGPFHFSVLFRKCSEFLKRIKAELSAFQKNGRQLFHPFFAPGEAADSFSDPRKAAPGMPDHPVPEQKQIFQFSLAGICKSLNFILLQADQRRTPEAGSFHGFQGLHGFLLFLVIPDGWQNKGRRSFSAFSYRQQPAFFFLTAFPDFIQLAEGGFLFFMNRPVPAVFLLQAFFPLF